MARPAAWASMAAFNQGKFWEYHDLIFENQRDLKNEKFEEFATKLGLDLDKFKKDFEGMAVKQMVARDYDEGRKIVVQATPTIYINGRMLRDRSSMGIQKLISEELSKAGGN